MKHVANILDFLKLWEMNSLLNLPGAARLIEHHTSVVTAFCGRRNKLLEQRWKMWLGEDSHSQAAVSVAMEVRLCSLHSHQQNFIVILYSVHAGGRCCCYPRLTDTISKLSKSS